MSKFWLGLPITSVGAPNLNGCIADAVDGQVPLPEVVAETREYWKIVADCLPPQQYTVVSLYFRDGFTQEDIAEKIHKSQQAVFRIIQSATSRLASVAEKLSRAMPHPNCARQIGHTAVRAYQVAQARGDKDYHLALEEEEEYDGRADVKDRAAFGRAWAGYVRD